MTTDILINLETNDVEAKDGDFNIGDATKQNQKILLVCNKGEIKKHPTICVGSLTFLEDENIDDLLRETRKEFVNDEMTVRTLSANALGKINVDAPYL